MRIYTKKQGETIDALSPLVTNGNPIPAGASKGNIITSDGTGFTQDSGVNVDQLYNLGLPTQTLASGTDFNTLTVGAYRIKADDISSFVNFPTNLYTANSGRVIVEEAYNGVLKQTIIGNTINYQEIVRKFVVGTAASYWTDWQQVMTNQTVSNPNLLINGDFRVNQRNGYYAPVGTTYYSDTACSVVANVITSGAFTAYYYNNNVRSLQGADGNTYYVKTSDCKKGYIGAGYTVDMWKTTSSSITTTINDDGTVTISANGAVGYYSQAFENTTLESLRGKTVTLTVEDGNGKMHSKTGVIPTTTDQQWYVSCSYYFGAADNVVVQLYNNSLLSVTFTVSNGSSLTLKSVKLEVGSVATPNSPRPCGEELALCQRYYLPPTIYMIPMRTAGGQLTGSLKLPCNMRIKPTLVSYELISVKGNGKDITTSATTVGVSYLSGHDLGVYVGGAGDINTANVVYITSVTLELSAEL